MTQYLLDATEQSQLDDLQRRVDALKSHAILQINNNLGSTLVDQFGLQIQPGHVQASSGALPSSTAMSLYDPVAGRVAPTAQYTLLILVSVDASIVPSGGIVSGETVVYTTKLFDRNGTLVATGPTKTGGFQIATSNSNAGGGLGPFPAGGTYEETTSFMWTPTIAVAADSGQDKIHLNGQDVFRGQFYATVTYAFSSVSGTPTFTINSSTVDALIIGQIP